MLLITIKLFVTEAHLMTTWLVHHPPLIRKPVSRSTTCDCYKTISCLCQNFVSRPPSYSHCHGADSALAMKPTKDNSNEQCSILSALLDSPTNGMHLPQAKTTDNSPQSCGLLDPYVSYVSNTSSKPESHQTVLSPNHQVISIGFCCLDWDFSPSYFLFNH